MTDVVVHVVELRPGVRRIRDRDLVVLRLLEVRVSDPGAEHSEGARLAAAFVAVLARGPRPDAENIPRLPLEDTLADQ
jgi:hypothetical protein